MDNTARKITIDTPIDDTQTFLQDVINGLSSTPKTLPCQYFYDDKGSALFEAICNTKEYYVTRTELALLKEKKHEIASMIGPNASIIEPGAGAMIKVIPLLEALNNIHAYIPTDISSDFLMASAKKLQHQFRHVNITPITFNFYETDNLSQLIDSKFHGKYLIFFPGSTIGNFDPQEAKLFLQAVAKSLRPGDAMLVGVDLIKSKALLEAAYNDKSGITSDFNKNLLKRINIELNGKIDLNNFQHHSYYNQDKKRIEMHLVSAVNQTIVINEQAISFSKDESIHTENSYKYSITDFQQLAQAAGFHAKQCWVDEKQLFSLHYLEAS